MNQVWVFLKILQIVTEITCLSIHMAGSLYLPEPLPHNLIFCGTYAGFLLLAIVRVIHLLSGFRTVLYMDFFFNVTGMLMHFMCAWMSMYHAENDFHLIYMGRRQELNHTFFANCKKQAVSNIISAALYLMHAVLLLDFIGKTLPHEDRKPITMVKEPPEWDDTIQDMNVEERDYLAKTTADVCLLNRRLDYWLCTKFKWFCQLAYGQRLQQKTKFRDRDTTDYSSRSYVVNVINLDDEPSDRRVAFSDEPKNEMDDTQFAYSRSETSSTNTIAEEERTSE